jgi:anti-anti-sigma factor
MTTHELHPVSLLVPQGHLWESAESEAVERALMALAVSGRRVIVDLSATGQITAHGLGVLAQAQRIALDHGGEIALCGARRGHRLLLAQTGLVDAFRVHPDRNAAMKAFAATTRAVA